MLSYCVHYKSVWLHTTPSAYKTNQQEKGNDKTTKDREAHLGEYKQRIVWSACVCYRRMTETLLAWHCARFIIFTLLQ